MKDDDRADYEAILKILKKVDGWLAYTDPRTPAFRRAEGCPLSGDDKRTSPYNTSHAAWSSLCHAVDHLHMHRTVLQDAKMLHTYGHYTLLRGAFENACTAVWLLAPSRREERVTRRLQLVVADARNASRVHELVGHVPAKTLEERLAQVREIAACAPGVDPGQAVRRVTTTDIVKQACEAAPGRSATHQLVWNLCSGAAHGDLWSMLTLADKVELPGGPPGIARLRVSANMSRLHLITFFAASMIDLGWRLFEQRSTSPFVR